MVDKPVSAQWKSKAAQYTPHRLLFMGGVNLTRLHSAYRGKQDALYWDRFSLTLGEAFVDTPDIAALVANNTIDIPRGCVSVMVQDYMGLSKEHPYTTVGIHYVAECEYDVLPRAKAMEIVYDELSPAYIGRNMAERMLNDVCREKRYVRRGIDLAMICPHRDRGLIHPRLGTFITAQPQPKADPVILSGGSTIPRKCLRLRG